jgi:hypothetical protein
VHQDGADVHFRIESRHGVDTCVVVVVVRRIHEVSFDLRPLRKTRNAPFVQPLLGLGPVSILVGVRAPDSLVFGQAERNYRSIVVVFRTFGGDQFSVKQQGRCHRERSDHSEGSRPPPRKSRSNHVSASPEIFAYHFIGSASYKTTTLCG